MAPDMADDIRVMQIIQGYSLSKALGLGVYGGFAYRAVTGLVSSETAFFGAAAVLNRLKRLAMRPDGEVALLVSENATREGMGRTLLRATYTAAYCQFSWGKAKAAPKRSAAQMRSCPDAGRLLRLGHSAYATLAECVCLAEAVAGAKRREALVKAYGEGTVRKVAGSPADPVTTAAIEALEREAIAVLEEAGRRISKSAEDSGRDIREISRMSIREIVSGFLPAGGGEPPVEGERGSRPDPEMIEALEARARRGRAEREGIAEWRDARIREIVGMINELRAAAEEAGEA